MAINIDAQQSGKNIAFIKNVLDGYENYTYNIELSLYSDAFANENRIPLPSDKHVVIAKSGETAQFVIQRMELMTIPGTNVASKSSMATKIYMEIVEPLGFTFIDRLINAGKYLGLKNLNQVPYVIALNFIGWDRDGNIHPSIVDTKYYRLILINVKPSLSSSASTYSLEFCVLNELVNQKMRSEAPKNIKFKKDRLLVDTLNNFADSLSQASTISSESDQNTKTIAGDKNTPNKLRYKYVFKVQDGSDANAKLSAWTMMSNLDQNANKQASVTDLKDGSINQEIVVQEGKDIFNVLTGILAHTNEAYKYCCPAATPNKADFDEEKEFNKWFHFETETTYDSFDDVTGSYSLTNTITIVPKIVSRLAVLTNQPAKEDSVKKIMSENLLIKKYDYIFTGENTSVLELNLDLNTFWHDSVLIFTAALANNGLSTSLNPSFSTNSTWDPNVVAVKKNEFDGMSVSEFINRFKDADKNNPSFQYLEQFPVETVSLESFARQEPDRDYSRSKNLTQGFSSPGGIVANSKLSIFSYICDSAYISTQNTLGAPTAMLKINMVIRGDPYWLGTSSEEMSSKFRGKSYEDVRREQSNYAVFQSGENNFFLRFKPPQGINNNTGLMNVGDTSVFNACYSVVKVRSIFNNGMFTQELEAVINRAFYTPAVQEVCNNAPEKEPISNKVDTNTKPVNTTPVDIKGEPVTSSASDNVVMPGEGDLQTHYIKGSEGIYIP